MNGRRTEDEELSFETVKSFTSEPPDDLADIHSARTAVAALPDSFLDDLKRGKKDDPTTSRYRVLPDTLMEQATPTAPPPPVNPTNGTRVRELNAAISAALSVAIQQLDPPPEACEATPLPLATLPPVVVEPAPIPTRSDPVPVPPVQDREQWLLIALAVALLVALAVARSGILFF